MTSIKTCPLPAAAALARYANGGAYTDCYATDIAQTVSQEQFVTAFYTTWIFQLERFILKWAVARPSTDEDAAQLARGAVDRFAAWSVEQRDENQLLMCDFQGRTRSWLMVAPQATASGALTRLYFGSAVVPVADKRSGKPKMGAAFKLLLGFHRIYSRVLLGAARSALRSAAIAAAPH